MQFMKLASLWKVLPWIFKFFSKLDFIVTGNNSTQLFLLINIKYKYIIHLHNNKITLLVKLLK